MFEQFQQYLQFEKRYSEHTSIAYLKDLEQFFEFQSIEEKDVSKVDHSMIRGWMVQLYDNDLTKKTINRKLSSLRTYFKWLKINGQIKDNPLKKIVGPKNEKRLPSFAKESEIETSKIEEIFDHEYEGLLGKVIFEVLYQTGIRLSELVGLKVADITSTQIKVLGKRNKERIIPISNDLNELFLKYEKAKQGLNLKNEYFFLLKNGNKVYAKFVYRKINLYLSSVTNLEKKSPHVLRHTFATHLLNNGVGLETLKDLLGHANLTATQVYTHNSFAQLTKVYSQAHPRGHKN